MRLGMDNMVISTRARWGSFHVRLPLLAVITAPTAAHRYSTMFRMVASLFNKLLPLNTAHVVYIVLEYNISRFLRGPIYVPAISKILAGCRGRFAVQDPLLPGVLSPHLDSSHKRLSF